jgi:hypothetical protein
MNCPIPRSAARQSADPPDPLVHDDRQHDNHATLPTDRSMPLLITSSVSPPEMITTFATLRTILVKFRAVQKLSTNTEAAATSTSKTSSSPNS